MGGIAIMANNLTIEKSLPRKYVQFPLFLMHDILENKVESINKILDYGIHRFAMGIDYNLKDVARQICYHNYRGDLSEDISEELSNYNLEYFGTDDDYNGFSDKTFNPEDEIIEILELFKLNLSLKTICIEFHIINQAFKLLNITGNADNIASSAKDIEHQISPKEVMPMVGVHILFNFRDNVKKEFEIVQLMAYISIQSILGVKSSAKTNKYFIINRMFGELNNDELKNKYTKRYHWELLLFILQKNWAVNIYSNRTRGIWVSIGSKFPLKQLIEHAEKIKDKNSVKNFNAWKQQLIRTTIVEAKQHQ